MPERRPRQIVAMGGGGFSMEPDNPLLDRYVLKLAGKRRPRVSFVPTASGDAEGYIEKFYESFCKRRCTPSHLSLFRPSTKDLRSLVLSQDIIYVGGGNTFNMLALWREWKLDRYLKQAWGRGVILAGVSAGSICWFEGGVTDSFGALEPLACLGFLSGSNCPHYDGEEERRGAYHRLVREGRLKAGYAADDGVALHFTGKRLAKVVSSRPDARAYRVAAAGGKVKETPIIPLYLGKRRR